MTIKSIAFDVFGTVVDWRGTIASEGRRLAGDAIDWDAFAESWSRAYSESLRAMGDWTNLDVMLASSFYRLASPLGLLGRLTLAQQHELATTWSRLKPWPDAVAGFKLLKDRYWLAAFSNANNAMLESLTEASRDLYWHDLISAESVKRYKPDPAFYRRAFRDLGGPTDGVILVASHCFDLNAARRHGFRTALIVRPSEPGSDPSGLDHEADVIADDLQDFAERMIA